LIVYSISGASREGETVPLSFQVWVILHKGTKRDIGIGIS